MAFMTSSIRYGERPNDGTQHAVRKPLSELRMLGKTRRVSRHDLGDAARWSAAGPLSGDRAAVMASAHYQSDREHYGREDHSPQQDHGEKPPGAYGRKDQVRGPFRAIGEGLCASRSGGFYRFFYRQC